MGDLFYWNRQGYSMKNGRISEEKSTPAESKVMGFGDRLWLFWNRFERQIYGAVGIFLLMALLVGAAMGYRYFRLRHMQSQWLSALDSPENLPIFTRKYASEPLASLMNYRLANEADASGNFSSAAENYKSAAGGFQAAELAPLSKIAEGIALLQESKGKEAEDLLKSLLQDGNTPSIFRAAAGYQLALQAFQCNDFQQTKLFLEILQQLPFTGIWGEKATLLAMAIGENAL